MVMSVAAALLGFSLFMGASAQPFQPGSGAGPLGNLRTSDYDGPYNVSMLSAQVRLFLGLFFAFFFFSFSCCPRAIIRSSIGLACPSTAKQLGSMCALYRRM